MAKKHKDAADNDVALLRQLGFSDRFIEGLLTLMARDIRTPVAGEADYVATLQAALAETRAAVTADMTATQHEARVTPYIEPVKPPGPPDLPVKVLG